VSDAKVKPIEMAEGSDIFATTCEAIVIPTNCRGANGAGLAKAAAARFFGWAKEHKEICARMRPPPLPGSVLLFNEGLRIHAKWGTVQCILALATKDHWRDPSRIEWVEAGLAELDRTVYVAKTPSVAIPALGCGTHTGQLAWTDVRPLILETAERMAARGVVVEVYPPAIELEAATKPRGRR